MIAQSVAEILAHHVKLSVEGTDRISADSHLFRSRRIFVILTSILSLPHHGAQQRCASQQIWVGEGRLGSGPTSSTRPTDVGCAPISVRVG